MPAQHWPPDAAAVALCHCGGRLMLVEDLGPKRPVEVQCATCDELTGLAHEIVKTASVGAAAPGSPEDLGF